MKPAARAVFDCNTLLQALAAPQGPAGRCVQLAIDGAIVLFICPEILEEFRDVTSRPRVAAKLRLTPERAERFLEAIETAGTLMVGIARGFAYERDPDDAIYVNLALAAGAEWVVTRDTDLLDLADLTKPGAREFQRRFPSLRIASPTEFLRECVLPG